MKGGAEAEGQARNRAELMQNLSIHFLDENLNIK